RDRPGRDGIDASAPSQAGRSRDGSRCTVPRGPCVLTRLRSSHSAARTSARVASVRRSATDASAADITCACAPHIAATAAAGVPCTGPASPARISLRALTCSHVISITFLTVRGDAEGAVPRWSRSGRWLYGRGMRMCLIAMVLAVLTVSGCGDDGPADPRLRAELLEMLRLDQEIRTTEAEESEWDRIEQANTERMR